MARAMSSYVQGTLFEKGYLLRSLGSIAHEPDIALTELVANSWDAGGFGSYHDSRRNRRRSARARRWSRHAARRIYQPLDEAGIRPSTASGKIGRFPTATRRVEALG